MAKTGYSEKIKNEVLTRVTGSEKESITRVFLDKKINKGIYEKSSSYPHSNRTKPSLGNRECVICPDPC